MKYFIPFTNDTCDSYKVKRFGLDNEIPSHLEDGSLAYKDVIEICYDLNDIAALEATYIIIGIPEDLGVRANMGRRGAHEAWSEFLKNFLNLQHNNIYEVTRFCILGHIETQDLMDQCESLDATVHKDRVLLSNAVEELDERVSAVVSSILQAKKTPVIIGGGHNNSYPILRSAGFLKPIDCINIDAHTDLRPAKGRHSGNGFSHAYKQGYLNKYTIIGIQEAYLTEPMLDLMMLDNRIQYLEYMTSSEWTFAQDIKELFLETDSENFGLEVDMDVVANFPSSAQSPVGISFEHLRELIEEIFVYARPAPKYIHFCEAAPRYGYENLVGKALATLVNDLP